MKKNIIPYLFLFLFLINHLFGQSYKISVLPISNSYSEFCPVVYKEKFLVFCSDRKNDLLKVITDTSGKYLSDLYQIDLSDTTNNNPLKLFSPEITTLFNEGQVTFNADFSTIYFTRNLHLFTKPKDIERKKNNLGIFIATKSDSGWTNIQPFINNSDDYNIAHPTLNNNGDLLFFSSDMPNGYGGSDLYFCKKHKGKWSKPKNMGNKINSANNEFFPFIHISGRMYFASDKKGGLGGLDIYYVDKTNNRWQNVLPLDTPFNSTADDFGIFVNASFESGYFSSNRNENDDIFKFQFQFPSFENCDSLQEPFLCYDLYEEQALDNDTMPLEYEWNFGDGTKAKGEEVNHCFPKPGHYIVKLNVINTVTNEISYNDATYDLDIPDFIQPKIHCPDTISINQPIQFSGTAEKYSKLENIRYFWDFGDGQKGKSKQIQHTFISQGNHKIKLIIIGKNSKKETKQYGVFKWTFVK